jgi:peptide deformylase
VFVIDARPFAEDEPEDSEAHQQLVNFKKVFINAQCTALSGELWNFNEGCLSIPKIREDVQRPSQIRIQYRDEHWNLHEDTFSGIQARIIQHEYDHIEGTLFTDRISPFKRKLLEGKLKAISKGIVEADYKLKRPRKS